MANVSVTVQTSAVAVTVSPTPGIGHRPWYDAGTAASSVTAGTGGDFASLELATRAQPVDADANRTITLITGTTATLPKYVSAWHGLTVSGATPSTTGYTVTDITTSSRANGLIVTVAGTPFTGSDAEVGTVIKFTSGNASGLYGCVYASTTSTLSVTLGHAASASWPLVAATDTFDVITLDGTIALDQDITFQSTTGLVFQDLVFTGDFKITVISSGRVVFDRCQIQNKGIEVLLGGGVKMGQGTCFAPISGISAVKGALAIQSGGRLFINSGALLDFTATDSGMEHLAATTGAIIEQDGEVCFRGVGAGGLDLHDTTWTTRDQGGEHSIRFVGSSVAAFRCNQSSRGAFVNVHAGDVFGAITDTYAAVAARNTWGEWGSSSSLSTGSDANAVSMDSGSTNTAGLTADGSRWVNGDVAATAASLAGHSHTESDVTDLSHVDTTAMHKATAAEVSAMTAKGTPTTSDYLVIEDAAAGDAKKSITIGDLPAATPASHSHTIADVSDIPTLSAKGGIWTGDASGDALALAVGTNDQVLTADSTQANGVKWAAAAGGGGGISYINTHANLLLETPEVNEFAIATDAPYLYFCTSAGTWRYMLDGIEAYPPPTTGWSDLNMGTAVASNVNGGIHMTIPKVSGTQYRAQYRAITYTTGIEACFSWDTYLSPGLRGMVARDSGTGRLKTFSFKNTNGLGRVLVEDWNSPTSYSAGVLDVQVGDAGIGPTSRAWVRLTHDAVGNFYHWWLSPDGYQWTDWAATADAFIAAPDGIGFGVYSNNSIYEAAIKILSWRDI